MPRNLVPIKIAENVVQINDPLLYLLLGVLYYLDNGKLTEKRGRKATGLTFKKL
jgi:hypothetical protein